MILYNRSLLSALLEKKEGNKKDRKWVEIGIYIYIHIYI